jgi:RNA polymerase sigma-70 factor (ECF subfamily)
LQDNDAPPDSLDHWVRQTWPRAVAYARSLLRDRPAAEDVVQDCYCNLLRKAADYDLLRDGVRLLMKAVSNACFKRNARERPMTRLDAMGTDGRRIDLPDCGTQPPRAALDAELERAVEDGLARLPQTQRAAIELKSLGHSLAEIAEILDVTPTNAGVLIHRGRQELARLLAPFLEDDAG